jgi:hypothetical protein
MRFFWLIGVLGLILIVACVSRHRTADSVPASAEQRPDVSTLVPADLAFAKPFVQLLLDGGWTVQPVRPSKLNGFFRATNKAAWIDTNKGVLEVIFFENPAQVEQIQITEERTDIATYHKYVLQALTETRRMEGGVTYFTKHGNMLIVTIDAGVHEALDRLFVSGRA